LQSMELTLWYTNNREMSIKKIDNAPFNITNEIFLPVASRN